MTEKVKIMIVIMATLLLLACLVILIMIYQRQRKMGKTEERIKEEASWKKQKAMKNWEIIHRFLPMRMLSLLGIVEDNVQTKELLSEQKELQAVFLSGGIGDQRETTRSMKTEEIYHLLNEMFACVIPSIRANHGIIDSFRNQTFNALFTSSAEDGVKAAVLIVEELLKSGKWKYFDDFSIGLGYGDISVGVVGFGDHLSVLTLSIYTGFGAFLQKTAVKYYSRILAMDSYVTQIPDFEKKYNYRLLGVFYINGLEKEEKVYDIFDGDEVGIRNLKRKTKMIFEKGVRLYLDRKFTDARGCFIEVLKADQNDKAARNYLFLCDRNRNLEPAELSKIRVYLGEY